MQFKRGSEPDYPLSRKFIKADSVEGSEIKLHRLKENKAVPLRTLMSREGGLERARAKRKWAYSRLTLPN